MGTIEVILGDITQCEVDAIVNAANRTLLGGGGVDGAIHRAAGPKLLAECATLGGCKTGEAKITKGYHLPAKYVIHTPGPVWSGGRHGEDDLLANCYRNCFQLATENRVKSIAFPAISTGVYHFPLDRATHIALAETVKALKKYPEIERVLFVCFSEETKEMYDALNPHEEPFDS